MGVFKMRKMDEMEMQINLTSIRFAYGYIIIFLGIWMVYGWIQNNSTRLPMFILLSQSIIYSVTTLYLRKNMKIDEK